MPRFRHSLILPLSYSLASFFCTCVNKQNLTNKVLLQEMKGEEKKGEGVERLQLLLWALKGQECHTQTEEKQTNYKSKDRMKAL